MIHQPSKAKRRGKGCDSRGGGVELALDFGRSHSSVHLLLPPEEAGRTQAVNLCYSTDLDQVHG